VNQLQDDKPSILQVAAGQIDLLTEVQPFILPRTTYQVDFWLEVEPLPPFPLSRATEVEVFLAQVQSLELLNRKLTCQKSSPLFNLEPTNIDFLPEVQVSALLEFLI
jgi:hypothetical protein